MNKKAKGLKSSPVGRGRNNRRDQPARYVHPFTELPDELKQKRFSFKAFFQGTLNFILLGLLGLGLVAMVAAFGYVMIVEPDKLVTFFSVVVKAGEAFITSLQ